MKWRRQNCFKEKESFINFHMAKTSFTRYLWAPRGKKIKNLWLCLVPSFHLTFFKLINKIKKTKNLLFIFAFLLIFN